ncbi:MAG: 50S ribosomal protein L4 [Patescibacteria group bacterium]
MPAKKIVSKKPLKVAIKKPAVPKKSVVKKVAVKKAASAKAVVSKPVVKEIKRTTGGLNADVYGMTGKIVSKLSLPKEIFGAKVNDKLMAQAVRVYLANQRSGTASTKTRGEVHGTTKKAWRQKGTGRARHGSKKAPIFVHGGIAHGPRPHDFSLKMPQKMRKAALFSALTFKNQNGEIKIISGLEKIEPKTKFMADVVRKLDTVSKKRNILLVTPDKEKSGLENLYRASRNIEGLRIIKADLVNTYEILNTKAIFLMKDAVDAIEKHFVKGGAN